MAFRKRSRSNARRRPTTRKRRTRRKKGLTMGGIVRLAATRQVGAYSKRQIVRLNWTGGFSLPAATAGTVQEMIFSTDPADPLNLLSGPYQLPTGWSEWETFYSNYYCLKAELTCIFMSNSTSQPETTPSIVYIRKNETAAAKTDRTEVLNGFNISRKKFGLSASGFPMTTIRAMIEPAKFLSRNQFDDTMKGSMNASGVVSSAKAFFHAGHTPIVNTVTGVAAWVDVKIVYTMALTNRKVLEDSELVG